MGWRRRAENDVPFAKGRHVRVSDLIVKDDGGEVFALIAGGRGEPGAGGHRTTFWPVRFVEALALPGDGRVAECPAWGNEDFLFQATASQVAACIEAGADPNARNSCDGYDATTSLGHAMAFSTPEVVNTLLEAGADPDFRYAGCAVPLSASIPYPGIRIQLRSVEGTAATPAIVSENNGG